MFKPGLQQGFETGEMVNDQIAQQNF